MIPYGKVDNTYFYLTIDNHHPLDPWQDLIVAVSVSVGQNNGHLSWSIRNERSLWNTKIPQVIYTEVQVKTRPGSWCEAGSFTPNDVMLWITGHFRSLWHLLRCCSCLLSQHRWVSYAPSWPISRDGYLEATRSECPVTPRKGIYHHWVAWVRTKRQYPPPKICLFPYLVQHQQ